MKKLLEIYKKYREQIAYLFFGGCTFVVNMVVHLSCSYILKTSVLVSTLIAWVVAVVFAYVTNKLWVFENKTETFKEFAREIGSFFSGRIATLVMEEVILFVFVKWLGLNEIVFKLIGQVLVIVANYFISKFIVFKK